MQLSITKRFGLVIWQPLIALLAVLFVKNQLWFSPNKVCLICDWSEWSILVLLAVDGWLSDSAKEGVAGKLHDSMRFRYGWLAILFLYIAVACLGKKILIAAFADPLWQTVGIAFAVLGILLRFNSLRQRKPDDMRVINFGMLFFWIGLAFVYGSWLPFFALPGLCILCKWLNPSHNKDLEQ